MSENLRWHLTVTRPVTLLDASLVLESDVSVLSDMLGNAYSQTFMFLEDGYGSFYVLQNEVDAQLAYLIKNKEKIHHQLDDYQRIVKSMFDDLSRFKKSPSNDLQDIEGLFSLYKKFVRYRVLTRIIGYSDLFSITLIERVAQLRMQFKNDLTVIRKDFKFVWHHLECSLKRSHDEIMSLTVFQFRKVMSSHARVSAVPQPLVLLVAAQTEKVLRGKEMKNFLQREIKEEISPSDQAFSGRSAYAGKVIGIVKIVRDPHLLIAAREEKKYILVTHMTTPDFVPLLRNTSAIITDEGGLTCHAAIIAREFRIPCIIGTKIATQLLKDGDRVEVDAERGIVKKLT